MAKNNVKKKSKQTKKKALSRGGVKRGRPAGSGRYGCDTTAVRVPIHLVEEVRLFIRRKIKAGFRVAKSKPVAEN
ncbi:MAG: hypothetical protein LBB88_10085 [Planctomycetaceae bacterium]|jgi:hypothetical protein|nr:hypothetical protein [Planctomycetaceae bacterium]